MWRSFLILLILFSAGITDAAAQTTCPMTFDQVTAISSSPSAMPSQLTVSGTGCGAAHEVQVTISCSGSITKHVTPDPTGRWSISLTSAEVQSIGCSCGASVKVSAGCMKGSQASCLPATSNQTVQCKAARCPVVTDITWNPLSCKSRPSGEGWPITFNASVTGNFSGPYIWSFGEDVITSTGEVRNTVVQPAQATPAPPQPQTVTYKCPRTSPPYKVSLDAMGCPGGDPNHLSHAEKELLFPACGTCPQISPITVSTSKCTATLSVPVSGCTTGVSGYLWNFGFPPPPATPVTKTSTVSTVTQDYPHDGSYTASVTLEGVESGQCSRSVQVNISGCAPPACPTCPIDHNGKGGSGGSVCGVFDWCCWLLGLFVGLYILFWVLWHYNFLPYAWYVGAAALVALLLWIAVCKPTYCGVLLVLFAAGMVALAIIGVIALVPIAPSPVQVFANLRGSYPAAILSVLTIIVIPLLALKAGCMSDCSDFLSCLSSLWRRARAGS